MARLRRAHEHVLEHCFTRFADRGLLREGIEPAFASRVLLDHILGYAVRERTVRALQSVPHDDTPMKDLTSLTSAFLAVPRPSTRAPTSPQAAGRAANHGVSVCEGE